MLTTLATFNGQTGLLKGDQVTKTVRKIKDLHGVFADQDAFLQLDPEQIVYEVEMHHACEEVEGGLFFGTSFISSGKVGSEFFMTKGHFHAIRNRGDYYWGIAGKGVLVLMDQNRKASTEEVYPGSLHYIPGHVAHRLVNIGAERLAVGACWPADAGHDYAAIQQEGFSLRIYEQNGQPIVHQLR